eukprot:CAMPEP_0171135138 /NCGR_PEP_ID=MMETSP0766_2-20121228/129297_1 /TAXON_ID=439317 /ORGANISM="Gambierdiscus australes, Strain CAWD 149" /LENGTH=115 /DNA_ID=CAMNT_0011598627 /DNA_START=25 /DNA_END=372 /DNA_ORIENTATION=-
MSTAYLIPTVSGSGWLFNLAGGPYRLGCRRFWQFLRMQPQQSEKPRANESTSNTRPTTSSSSADMPKFSVPWVSSTADKCGSARERTSKTTSLRSTAPCGQRPPNLWSVSKEIRL